MTNSQLLEFRVPDLGEGLEDATITGWSVDVGDTVELNQVVCTLETNKAEVEIPSPYAGRIAELGGAVGETLAVGAVLVRVEGPSSTEGSGTGERSDGGSGTDERSDGGSGTGERSDGASGAVLVGYGADERMDGSRRARAKPSIRKLARANGVDLTALTPTGPDGIVTRDDVLAASATSDLVPLTGVQAEMAKRMSMSRSRIPDAHASVIADGTNLQALAHRLQMTPFVLTLRLLTLALQHHPLLNSTWVDTPEGPRIHHHSSIHLGIGVATARGLLVPVVVDAHARTTRALADEVTRLVEGARGGGLRPAELMGSTFTVSNFGALGLDDGVPVINYPEAAILGMGSLKPRAVVVDGAVVARATMSLTCAFDHRIADGAQAAEFLCELRDLIETPELALADL
ncbi:pyruvate/2-oxoglutarate dehydrogenase complex, dihydrolipoamide acyltransferase component [Mycolicibacterium canariasense]|uniref:Dihydrolipoamide acetyltransferase component of pyruvate dehydrogenase complex n=1 Tax=Mycolicibacterium canariasense TaxID=228230 RepID=A0A100WFA1_MYCCR|nr:dihydrolipoamide acetyltransferase family protein [Mycolicibacterium canariasense]MCV7211572.1 2-oxo acid dehydrogenase subunit E2 [Mycolicibacterium canariasense]ORV00375.1 branched-chain alpha-keto acid dehydrogenase subunit E2 [Mycolicibacterium canariasense]GAS97021.1 pyruvate/2-oxoglutarate dehydrogenase complex, dihydrolipoamide acyltransferase component [Mycolicibacterium canariasense]